MEKKETYIISFKRNKNRKIEIISTTTQNKQDIIFFMSMLDDNTELIIKKSV